MLRCNCGRHFKAAEHLLQHQQDKARSSSANLCQIANSPIPVPKTFACGCGRQFKAFEHLEQHQRQKAEAQNPSILCQLTGLAVVGLPTKEHLKRDPQTKAIPSFSAKEPLRDSWMGKRVKEQAAKIELSSLEPSALSVCSSHDEQLICSYNWADQQSKAIYVPGCPPRWKGMNLPAKLSKDSGLQYIDQNAARIPKHPFATVFLATALMRPEYRFDHVDVLINRNSLRKFLDLCRGNIGDSFRVNLFVVNNTLIVERCEKNAKSMIRGKPRLAGYGHSFEKVGTELPDNLTKSISHHRVLEIKLAGLNCAVRCEVDASYDGDQTGAEERVDVDGIQDSTALSTPGCPGATPAHQKHFKANQEPPADSQKGNIQVIARGTSTAQSSCAEIKTKTRSKSSASSMPQLWFGRTPFLISGLHDNGNFTRIDILDVRENLEEWEKRESNQIALRKMTTLLHQLRDIVQGTKRKACVGIYERRFEPRALQIFLNGDGRKALPDEIIAQFWTAEDS